MGKATIDFDDLIDAVAKRMKSDGQKLVGTTNKDGLWTVTEPYAVISDGETKPILLRDAILDLLVERVAWTLPSENEVED
jgi:hypothetical protein